jgi:plasmid stabilization system protein ParE
MRRIVYAESFVNDADRIAEYIERRFGAARSDMFVLDLNRFCGLVAQYPGIGRQNHGYGTTLHGIVYERNWIFFEYDDSEIRFVHLIEGMRDKHIVRL